MILLPIARHMSSDQSESAKCEPVIAYFWCAISASLVCIKCLLHYLGTTLCATIQPYRGCKLSNLTVWFE